MASELKAKQYSRNIAAQCEEYQKIYGANKNLYRHIASIDGLKPVQRRILYTLYSDRSFPIDKYSKVQSISGSVMLHFHPHGDQSIPGVIYGMGQTFSNNLPLIDKEGNFGSVDGEAPAAPRYTEGKLSQFALDCYFKDFDKRYIDMKESYNGTDYEPEYLPMRYPVALVNGIYGSIGYGLSSNVPPYNFTELCEATIKLIKNPKAKIYLVPDSPTGCDVYDDKNTKDSFNTGFGKVTYQASYTIDYQNNIVTFTSMPPMVNLRTADGVIADLKNEGKLPDLIDKRNESGDKKGIVYKLLFRSDANIDDNLEKIFKSRAGFRKTHPTGIVLIDDYKAFEFSVPKYLLTWIEKRKEQIRSQYNLKYVTAMSEFHMNEIKLFVFNKDNIEKTISMAKKSANKKEYKDKLVSEYGITYIQAEVIANMRTTDFNKDAYQGFKERKKELLDEIEAIKKIISSNENVAELIISQLKEGIKEYGTPRRSAIIHGSKSLKHAEDVVIAVSSDGFIKRLPIAKTSIGKITKASGMRSMVNQCTTADNLLIFDETGRITRLEVSKIPDMKVSEYGLPIVRYVSLPGKRIVAVVVERGDSDKEDADKYDLVMVTEKGTVKKTSLSEFMHIRTDLTAINTSKGNELISVITAKKDTEKDIIIYTDKGNGIRLDLQELRRFGRLAKGTSVVTLDKDEKVIGCNRVDTTNKYLFIISSSGKAKLCKLEYFPVMKKKDKVLSLINLDAREKIVGAITVSDGDEITMYKKMTDPERVKVADMKLTTRVAKGTKMVKTTKGDSVIAFSVNE
ncbi:MAG TPA: hypothetical protein DCW90_00230 [Lachnospiraceae bacterium]|mgnify:CR=1 FL=1|nr:hypothetical protein [Lachnospiraceae bacterium]